MHIPLTERMILDGRIHEGVHAGEPFFKRMALLNTLIHLAPRVCLEIGTYHGDSAKIFSQYFDQYRPDGVLITADIRILLAIEDPRVWQARVYPHIPNIFEHHSVRPNELLSGWRDHLPDSTNANCDILRRYLQLAGATAFDFAFVDGDHTEVSVMKDLEIVRRLVRPPHYALFDNIHEDGHELGRLYQERLVREYNTYEFEEFVGLALLWEKQKGTGMSKRGARKEIERILAAGITEERVYQRKPWTCYVAKSMVGGQVYQLLDFAKVMYPDRWSPTEGARLAKRKALAYQARVIMLWFSFHDDCPQEVCPWESLIRRWLDGSIFGEPLCWQAYFEAVAETEKRYGTFFLRFDLEGMDTNATATTRFDGLQG